VPTTAYLALGSNLGDRLEHLRAAVRKLDATEGVDVVRPRLPITAVAGLALVTIAVFYLGIMPTRVLDLALDSISTIF